MKLFTLSVLSASTAVCGTAMAGVDSINCYFNGVSPGENVSVVLNGGGVNTTAGAFNWTRDGTNPGTLAGFTGNFQTFCIDLTQFISPGGLYSYSTFPAALAPTSGAGNSPMGVVREALLGRMFALYYSSLSTSAEYAGFQLAVWEIALDGDMNLGTGMFQTTGASAGALLNANTYLAGSLTHGVSWSIFAIDDPIGSNTAIQGQIMIPTPGSAALLGVGVLAASRRRRV